MNPARVTLRLGTWNLAGRWSERHKAALAAVDCDVWLLTEVRSDTAMDGYQPHFSAGFMATDRHWAGLLFRRGTEIDGWRPDPHPASAAATVEGITYCSSILPWRACGTKNPWIGGTCEAKTDAATRTIATALPAGTTVWGGDWNHGLSGPERAGSRAGRDHINRTLDSLELRAVTTELAHRIDGLRTIDHIAVPKDFNVQQVRRIEMTANGRPLSDHDAYVVEAIVALPL